MLTTALYILHETECLMQNGGSLEQEFPPTNVIGASDRHYSPNGSDCQSERFGLAVRTVRTHRAVCGPMLQYAVGVNVCADRRTTDSNKATEHN